MVIVRNSATVAVLVCLMVWFRRLLILFGVGVASVLGPVSAVFAGPAQQQIAQSFSSVWCLDESRNHVRKTPAWRCKGKVVSAEEANRIKVSRFQRIKRRVNAPKQKLFPGKRQRGSGSGFFVTKLGHVLTNGHVIRSCKAYSVTPSGGRAIAAKLIAKDSSKIDR